MADRQAEVARWLIEWFSKRGEVPGSTPAEQLTTNYFDAKLIDSLGVVELIGDVEEQFQIQFDAEHFQDRRFAVMGGLAQMIVELGNSHASP